MQNVIKWNGKETGLMLIFSDIFVLWGRMRNDGIWFYWKLENKNGTWKFLKYKTFKLMIDMRKCTCQIDFKVIQVQRFLEIPKLSWNVSKWPHYTMTGCLIKSLSFLVLCNRRKKKINIFCFAVKIDFSFWIWILYEI